MAIPGRSQELNDLGLKNASLFKIWLALPLAVQLSCQTTLTKSLGFGTGCQTGRLDSNEGVSLFQAYAGSLIDLP